MENPEQPAQAPGRWEQLFLSANRWALILLVAAMSVLVISNVISRYVFLHSFTWVEEASRYLMIWTAFLGAGLALRVGGHIAVDSLPAALPPKGARVLRTVITAILGVTLVALTWLGVEYAEFGWEQETPVLGWSFGMVYLAVPIGALLMLAHLALVARRWIATGQWEHVDGFDPQAL